MSAPGATEALGLPTAMDGTENCGDYKGYFGEVYVLGECARVCVSGCGCECVRVEDVACVVLILGG